MATLPSSTEASRHLVPSGTTEVAPPSGRRFGWRDVSTLLPTALAGGLVLQHATRWGAGHRELLSACLVVALTQLVPGMVVWRCLRPRDGWWVEDVALGLAVGATLAVPSQIVAVWLSVAWLAAAVPLVVAAALLALPSTRTAVLSARTRPLPWLWGTVVAAACTLPLVNAVAAFREPVRWRGWATPYVDLPYHLALSGELSHRFTPHYPQLAAEPLAYHWFSHAWVAQVSALSGTELDVVLMRLLPVLIAVAVPLATAAVALRLTRLSWAGPLAALVAFAVADFDVWGFGRTSLPIATAHSPTQGFGLLVLLPVLALLALRWRGMAGPGTHGALLGLLVVAGGSKGSMLPVLVAGAVLACATYPLHRAARIRTMLLDTATAIIVLLLLMRFLFRGGVGGMTLSVFDALARSRGEGILGTGADIDGLMLVSVLLLALLPVVLGAGGALVVLLGQRTREDPVGWLLAGAALSGIAAILVLDHPGMSQFYFLWTAELPLSILVAWGLAVLLERLQYPKFTVTLGAATGIAGVGVAGGWPGPLEESTQRLGTAWIAVAVFLAIVLLAALTAALALRRNAGEGVAGRTALAVAVTACSFAGVAPVAQAVTAGLPEDKVSPERVPGAIHSTEVVAARWLRDQSHPDDLVITNQHCRKGRGQNCDHRHFTVAAYAERGVLVEGWAYTKTANILGSEDDTAGISGSTVAFWNPDLLALNDGFLTSPSEADARRLHDMGVRWVYLYRDAPGADDLAPYAVERFRAGRIRVLELLDPTASG